MDQEIRAMFRAYDIRGNTDEGLTPEVMERIGKAYGTFLHREADHDEVSVGRDARNTSRELHRAFINGLRTTPVGTIHDLGLQPFGVVLYHAWSEGNEAAFITASHLSKEWNGVKFYHPDGVGYEADENEQIRDIFDAEDFAEGDAELEAASPREEYLDYLVETIDGGDLDIVLDCGNGVGGLTAPHLFKRLGFDVDTLFEEPDGDFPNRASDITDESMAAMKEEVGDHDLGIAYDGDSDRCGLITPSGRVLSADETAYLVLDQLLEERPGPVIANVECSRMVEEVATEHGCEVERIRVGHPYLYNAVRELDAVFGVEKAGHFAVPHVFNLDDAVAASAVFASLLADSERSIQEQVDDLPTYHGHREAFDCLDSTKFDVVAALQERYAEEYEDTNTIDGVRVDLDDGWILVRASNTSPKIRLTVEAESEDAADELKQRFADDLEQAIEEMG
ncbi:MAG: hypothetical protein SV186_05970 [Candidatus Nanohaloarchaea archaeon]|nr:hypothetical protein [Candidatus Nanohaloarchaea archaeon]